MGEAGKKIVSTFKYNITIRLKTGKTINVAFDESSYVISYCEIYKIAPPNNRKFTHILLCYREERIYRTRNRNER